MLSKKQQMVYCLEVKNEYCNAFLYNISIRTYYRIYWSFQNYVIYFISDPSTIGKNTRHFAGHLEKNTAHLTGLQKPVALHLLGIIVSRQYSKSRDVGIYRAGTLLPEIIVTPFTQKHILHCYVHQLRISEHTKLNYSR